METPKSLTEAIARGFSVGRLVDVQARMRIWIEAFLKRKFAQAFFEIEQKPYGKKELEALLEEIISGAK